MIIGMHNGLSFHPEKHFDPNIQSTSGFQEKPTINEATLFQWLVAVDWRPSYCRNHFPRNLGYI